MANKLIKTDLDFEDVSRIKNLPDAVDPQEPATLAQLNAVKEGLAWKDDVRAASTANINLASPGANIDDVAMSNGESFLAKDQTDESENGLYIWNGAAVPATRRDDASTGAELTAAVVSVSEGTANANTTWRQTQIVATIDTDDVIWTTFGANIPDASETVKGKIEIADQTEVDAGTDDTKAVTPLKLATYAGLTKKFSATIGDNSNTQIDVTHNLGTVDTLVRVRNAGGNKDEVICEVRDLDTNNTRLIFTDAPATNALRVTIMG